MRKYCKCGCGQLVKPRNIWINYHYSRSKKCRDQCRQLGFDSTGKSRLDMIGSRNPKWVDGQRTNLDNWRLVIYERENYTCQICGHKGESGYKIDCILAHHIKPRDLYLELIYDVDNGWCLCVSCHHRLHRFAEQSPYPSTWEKSLVTWREQILNL